MNFGSAAAGAHLQQQQLGGGLSRSGLMGQAGQPGGHLPMLAGQGTAAQFNLQSQLLAPVLDLCFIAPVFILFDLLYVFVTHYSLVKKTMGEMLVVFFSS